MHPTIFHIAFIKITSLTFFSILALFTFFGVMIFLAKKNRQRLQFLSKTIPGMLILGTVIGRLFEVILNLNYYWIDISFNSIYKSIAIWHSPEISFVGFIIGFCGFFLRQIYYKQEHLRKWADIFIISSFAALTIYSIGAFLAGINYGKVTETFLGITFNNPIVKYTLPIYPTQIFAAIYNLILTIFTYTQYSKTKNKLDGYIFLQGIFIYSLFRFIESFFRGDEVPMLWNLIRLPMLVSFIVFYLSFKAINNYEKKFIK